MNRSSVASFLWEMQIEIEWGRRIKSTAIKKAAKTLTSQNPNFNANFENNKELIKNIELPDKGTRNKIAGYITRLKRAEKSLKTIKTTNAQ